MKLVDICENSPGTVDEYDLSDLAVDLLMAEGNLRVAKTRAAKKRREWMNIAEEVRDAEMTCDRLQLQIENLKKRVPKREQQFIYQDEGVYTNKGQHVPEPKPVRPQRQYS